MKKELEKNHKRNSYNKIDDNIQKYKNLKHEINSIIRNINIKFNFTKFTKEELQPLETVRKDL
jgi:hypothetical protein